MGKDIFTLPICLRKPGDPGYPLSDDAVVTYFKETPCDNDSSLTVLWAISCFLTAAYTNMLSSLQKLQEQCPDGADLRLLWHRYMEHQDYRDFRRDFFSGVADDARKVNLFYLLVPFLICLQLRGNRPSQLSGTSPKRGFDGEPDRPYNSVAIARRYYEQGTMKATTDLMEFIQSLSSDKQPLCVTYFDEAHELGVSFWVMLRLLQAQDVSVGMWFVFMGTKSSISYYAPAPENCESFPSCCESSLNE